MKKKIFKFFSRLMIAVLVITMLCSLASAGIVVASYFIDDLYPISFVYVLVGEAIIPIEYLVNGKLGSFYTSTMNILSVCISLSIFIICLLAIREFSRIGRKNKLEKHNNSFVATMVISLILMGYYAFNAIMIFVNYLTTRRYLNRNLSGVVEDFVENIGNDVVIIKFFTICALIVGLALILFIFNFICKEKGEMVIKGNKTVVQALTFYSDEFIKNEEGSEEKEEKTIQEENILTEQATPKIKKKQSEDLITKIMQLNELKNSGQINEVEYTKLRQKAIKRYRG